MIDRLIPLYFFIAGGWYLGRFHGVDAQTPAKILIYFTVPIVIFCGIVDSPLVWSEFSVPVLIYGIGAFLCLTALALGKAVLGEGAPTRLLAFGAGNANSGYFGLPIAISLYGPDIVGLAALFFVGFIGYENTIAFYVLARGKYSVRESLVRLSKLPAVYAIVGGLLFKALGLGLPHWTKDVASAARGTYSILGMAMLGLAIAPLRRFRMNWGYLSLALAFKFIAWPLLALAFVSLDRNVLHVMSERAHALLILFSAVPLAGNTVAFSALLKLEPEMAALAVLVSTLLCLVTIPLMVGLGG